MFIAFSATPTMPLFEQINRQMMEQEMEQQRLSLKEKIKTSQQIIDSLKDREFAVSLG